MKKNKSATKKILWAFVLLSTLSLIACGREPDDNGEKEQFVNPAAEYCIINGWEYEVIDEELWQVWVCSFSEYWVCEEWDFYNTGICGEFVDENNTNVVQNNDSEEDSDYEESNDEPNEIDEESHWVSIANPASEFCEQLWWMVSIIDSEWGEIWMCNFSDWTSCEEWSLFNKECWLNKIPAEMLWIE